MRAGLLLATAILLGLSLIGSEFPRDQKLQHTPTVIAMVLLAIESRNRLLTRSAFCCLIAFLWLHILGARYVYSNVPYDRWATTVFGSSVSDWFAWNRNHYDRFVHFAFGMLCMIPLAELAQKTARMTKGCAILFALTCSIAIGGSYEIFEWLLTWFVSPADAEAYNGQQGDFWDAQKDMALALIGSVLMIPVLALRRDEIS